jgi:hypothetical protein
MRKRLAGIIFILLCFFTLSLTHAMEIKQGRIRLVLHEHSGVFSLYYLEEQEKGKYVPLLPDKDPRTSFLSISIWNNIYRMGENAEFIERVERTSRGGRFIWTSKRLTVIEDFIIQEDIVKIILVLFNMSNENQSVGVRYLFDTYLGEKGGPHFVTNTGVEINKETTFSSQNPLDFWVSPLQSKKGSEKITLSVLTRGSEVTVADRIIFANWNRLNESLWNYHTDNMRSFNDLPYSINDSAVCQLYNPQVLASGASRKIVLVLSRNPDSFGGLPLIAEKEKIEKEEIKKEEPADLTAYTDKYAVIIENMNTINRVIKDINQKINTSEAISEDDINSFRRTIKEIEKRIEQ